MNKLASPLGYLAAGIFLFVVTLGLLRKKRSLISLARRKESILLFTLGFVSVLLELILLLGYQIISGDVYWQMGVLFASFMFGLFLGSLLGNQFRGASRQRYFLYLTLLSSMMIGLSLGVAFLLPRLTGLSVAGNMLTFISLLAAIGTVVGAAFVIAGFLISENEIIAKAGNLYAADLWGASLGAILSTNVIVPLFGILGALYFSAAIGVMGLTIFLMLSRRLLTLSS